MIGLLLVGIVAVYIAIASFVVTRAKTRRTRILLTVVVLVLPFVERTLATIQFRRLCSSEYGVVVMAPQRVITSLELESPDPSLIERFKELDRVQVKESWTPYLVWQRSPNGEVAQYSSDSSAVEFRFLWENTRDWLNIRRRTISIVDVSSGQTIVAGTWFDYYGDLLVRMLSPSESGGWPDESYSCGPMLYVDDLLAATNPSPTENVLKETTP